MAELNNKQTPLPQKVNNYITRLVKEKGLQNVKVEARPAVARGNNFMGVLSRVVISGEKDNEGVEIRLIVKQQVTDESVISKVPVSEIFNREIFVYNDVKKIFQDLQENLPLESKFVFPECCFTDMTNLQEILVLEDLVDKQFEVYPKLRRMDLEHATLILKYIGKFHGLSFVLQATQPEKYKKLKDNLGDILFKSWSSKEVENDTKKYLLYHLGGVLAALQSEDHRQRMTKFGEDILQRVLDCIDSGPHSAIIHGDCWACNVLFKYEEGKPVDIRFVDYQLTRHSTPALDVLYFIFCCTDGKLRGDHFDEMLEIYYNSLTEQMRAFSVNVSSVYPRRVFYEELKKHSLSALALVTLDLTLVTRDEDQTQELSEMMAEAQDEGQDNSSKSSPLFKERINDLIRDLVKYGYL